MNGELLVFFLSILPALFLLLYLKRERRRWEVGTERLNGRIRLLTERLAKVERRAKAEAKESPPPDTVNLTAFTAQVIELVNESGKLKGNEILFDRHQEELYTELDRRECELLLTALLADALKQSGREEQLTLGLYKEGDRIALSLFKFSEHKLSKTSDEKSLKKRFSALHRVLDGLSGSSLKFYNKEPGEEELIVYLKSYPPSRTRALSPYLPLPLEWVEETLYPALPEELYLPARKTLLLVESDRTSLITLINLFKSEYNLLYAQSGREALKRLEGAHRADLLICPVKGKGIEGLRLFNLSRELGERGSLPFIFIIDSPQELKRVAALNRCGADFIERSALNLELKYRISNSLRYRGFLKELESYKADQRITEKFDRCCREQGLKGKQKEVARLLMDNPDKTNEWLCGELDMTFNTLRTHTKRIAEKLGVMSRKKEVGQYLRSICYLPGRED